MPGFDPRALADRAALRAELGYGEEPLCLVSVGGSGVGAPLLRRVIEALPLARERVPGLRTVAVAGPRIDPAEPAARRGARGARLRPRAVPARSRRATSRSCRAGSRRRWSSSPARRPFVSLPLASHFEQRFHVRHRLDRYGARTWLDYEEASRETLADAIVHALGSTPAYRAVEPGGAERAAGLIAELLRR